MTEIENRPPKGWRKWTLRRWIITLSVSVVVGVMAVMTWRLVQAGHGVYDAMLIVGYSAVGVVVLPVVRYARNHWRNPFSE